jgi:hypothetical protein
MFIVVNRIAVKGGAGDFAVLHAGGFKNLMYLRDLSGSCV